MVENIVQGEWHKFNPEDTDYGVIYTTLKNGQSGFAFSKTENDEYYIIKDGTLSCGPFANVQRMADGFIKADTGDSSTWIDVIGRFSPGVTKSGVALFSYLNGYLKLADLPSCYFADDLFYATVVREEKEIAINNIKLLYSDDEKISNFDVKRARNVASIIEAKRKGYDQLAEMLVSDDAFFAAEREHEKKQVMIERQNQDESIESAFDKMLEKI